METPTPDREEILPDRRATIPQKTTLSGTLVTIVPLHPPSHGDSLFEAVCGSRQDDLWTYLFDGPFSERAAFYSYLHNNAASRDPLFFAIVDNRSGKAVGHAAYMRVEPNHRVIEVGSILYSPELQRTPGATEAMYLMARHVFEELGYRRYEWKCDASNEPSRKAALRLGFRFEGIFRQHMIIKGKNRDTAWFSMLDREWPGCRRAFERWLAPANFDESGIQRVGLAALRHAQHFQRRIQPFPDVSEQD